MWSEIIEINLGEEKKNEIFWRLPSWWINIPFFYKDDNGKEKKYAFVVYHNSKVLSKYLWSNWQWIDSIKPLTDTSSFEVFYDSLNERVSNITKWNLVIADNTLDNIDREKVRALMIIYLKKTELHKYTRDTHLDIVSEIKLLRWNEWNRNDLFCVLKSWGINLPVYYNWETYAFVFYDERWSILPKRKLNWSWGNYRPWRHNLNYSNYDEIKSEFRKVLKWEIRGILEDDVDKLLSSYKPHLKKICEGFWEESKSDNKKDFVSGVPKPEQKDSNEGFYLLSSWGINSIFYIWETKYSWVFYGNKWSMLLKQEKQKWWWIEWRARKIWNNYDKLEDFQDDVKEIMDERFWNNSFKNLNFNELRYIYIHFYEQDSWKKRRVEKWKELEKKMIYEVWYLQKLELKLFLKSESE